MSTTSCRVKGKNVSRVENLIHLLLKTIKQNASFQVYFLFMLFFFFIRYGSVYRYSTC